MISNIETDDPECDHDWMGFGTLEFEGIKVYHVVVCSKCDGSGRVYT